MRKKKTLFFAALAMTIAGCMSASAQDATETDRFFTTSDGVRLHYRVAGQGDPLVLLPGYGGNTNSFAPNYEALEEEFTVYTLDYRAHGQSEIPGYGYHTERLAMDFKELLDTEEIEICDVIAHSMGNSVVWCYFELFGQDRIDKYVLYEEGSTFLSDPSWSEEEQREYRGTMDWPMWLDEDMLTAMAAPQEGDSEEDIQMRRDAMARLWKDHIPNDWSDIIPTIQVDTLILMGGQSHFASEELWDFTKESIEGSELVVIEEAGHGVNVDCPDEFNQAVLDFLIQ